MSPMRCYGPAIVLVLYAVARTAGATDEAWLVLFLVIEATTFIIYVQEVRFRIRHTAPLAPPAPLDDAPFRERRQWSRRDMLRDFVTLLAVGMAAYAVTGVQGNVDEVERIARENAANVDRIAAESQRRRDETCRLFERQELTEVTRLRGSYAYLAHLPREEYGTNLTKAVVRGLARQREEAKASRAPAYCNEPKGAPVVGLPEPGPSLPKPRDFRSLLKPQNK